MILQRMKEELRRDMILLGKKNIGELSKENLAFVLKTKRKNKLS